MFREEIQTQGSVKETAFHDIFPEQPFLVTNYKCRFLCQPLKKSKLGDLQQQLQRHQAVLSRVSGNSCTIRTQGKGVFIQFLKGHVNVCGLSTWKDVQASVEYFNSILQPEQALPADQRRLLVDNISLSGRLRPKAEGTIKDFRQFLEVAARRLSLPYSYDVNRFSGAALRSPYGTLILFPSATCNCMGLSSPDQLPKVGQILEALKRLLQERKL